MKIEFARGDSYEQGFGFKDKTGAAITDVWDEVYFTVKKYHTDDEFKLQKRLTDGGIVHDGDGHYTVFIAPEDTNDLSFGEYEFDIEVIKEPTYKKTFCGTLKLTREVTYQSNE